MYISSSYSFRQSFLVAINKYQQSYDSFSLDFPDGKYLFTLKGFSMLKWKRSRHADRLPANLPKLEGLCSLMWIILFLVTAKLIICLPPCTTFLSCYVLCCYLAVYVCREQKLIVSVFCLKLLSKLSVISRIRILRYPKIFCVILFYA